MKFSNLAILTIVALVLGQAIACGAGESSLPAANSAQGTNLKSANPRSETAPKAVLASATSATTPSASLIGTAGQSMDALNDKRQLGIGDKVSFVVVEDEIPPV